MQIILTLKFRFCTAEKDNDILKIYMLQISEKHCRTGYQSWGGGTLSNFFFFVSIKKERRGKVDNHVM